jgi:hypothetical protein
MNNQFLLWCMLILPWLTIFFMKKEDIKRYMPAALFTIVTSLIIADIGSGLKLWEIKETIYPLKGILPFSLSALPVASLWFLKFLYGRFWLYSVIQLVFSIAFAYILLPWLNSRDILVRVNGKPFMTLLINIVHFILIYLYHKWQSEKVPPLKKC